MKALNVIESAYRGTLEEQDDTIVWFTHALTGAGGKVDVLLRGNAVNYASRAQKVSPLRFGDRAQKNAPMIARDIGGLIEKGVSVFVVAEDLVERGIDPGDLVDGVEMLPNLERPRLYDRYDQVWHW